MKKLNKHQTLTIIVGIIRISTLLLITIILFLKPKRYEVIVLDSLGYVSDYWEDIRNVKILDSVVYMNDILITYKLKQGEELKINEYTY